MEIKTNPRKGKNQIKINLVLTGDKKLLHTKEVDIYQAKQKSTRWGWLAADADEWLWRTTPAAAILLVRITMEMLMRGWGKINWLGNGQFIVGWVIGYILGGLDDWFYVWLGNPEELTIQRVKKEMAAKNFGKANQLLMDTRDERHEPAIRNIITGLIVATLGVWLLSSSGSFMGYGVVISLSARLWREFVETSDYKKWYWPLARIFSTTENRLLQTVWALLVAVQILIFIRA